MAKGKTTSTSGDKAAKHAATQDELLNEAKALAPKEEEGSPKAEKVEKPTEAEGPQKPEEQKGPEEKTGTEKDGLVIPPPPEKAPEEEPAEEIEQPADTVHYDDLVKQPDQAEQQAKKDEALENKFKSGEVASADEKKYQKMKKRYGQGAVFATNMETGVSQWFTAMTWKELSAEERKNWREVVEEPAEVKALREKQAQQ